MQLLQRVARSLLCQLVQDLEKVLLGAGRVRGRREVRDLRAGDAVQDPHFERGRAIARQRGRGRHRREAAVDVTQ